MNLKAQIKGVIPKGFWKWLHNSRAYATLLPYQIGANRAERMVRKKNEPLNVLFFAIYESMWKYDSLFQLLLKDPNYNPQIIVCNITDRGGREYMLQTMRQCGEYFEKKGYPFVYSYDADKDSYLDPYVFQPDIIFYTSSYSSFINERYRRENFKNVLSCYVNYLYVSNNEPWSCANYFHQSLWRYYLEYPALLEQINDFCAPYKINGRVVGYPLFDTFRLHEASDKDWPIAGARKKRIIWAPHHSITGHTGINAFSTFEKYYDYMFEMAEKYKDKIQIVFKPHPTLRTHLYEAKDWGKERTDAYYERWANGENTAFVDGEYVGLFLASDAMMHDCHSFTVEYLAVNKPALFLDSGMTDDKMNSVAVEARACYYKGKTKEDVERFIRDVVLGGKDEYREKRVAFNEKYILPENGKLAAENIMDDLNSALGRRC